MNTPIQDKARFGDTIGVTKKYATSVLIEGVEVPIIHQFGKHNVSKYPAFKVKLAKLVGKFVEKAFDVPVQDKFFGSESLIVEKYKEVNVPGIGNDAVNILAKRGNTYRQICKKIGKCVLTEINISHIVRELKSGRLNLMLDEGVDEMFDLLTETNAIDYYTNALARMGVGNGNGAAVKTQTALLGGSTAFAVMEGGFPDLGTAQRVDFKGSYASGIAEFAWEEFSVDNAAGPNANLQRLVSAKGTKSTGETWTAEIQITGS